jgi:hypothetical protein
VGVIVSAVVMTFMVMRVAAMVVGHRDRLSPNRRCHREEGSGEAIQGPWGPTIPGLLRFARDDGLFADSSTSSSGLRIKVS